MTNPPQGGQPERSGQPEQFGQQPGPHGPPGGQYGQPGPYGQAGQYGSQQQSAYGQGPQPAWPQGWEAAEPPRRRRGRRSGTLVFLTVIVVGVLVYVFASGTTRLDPSAVERDVAEQFQEREGVALDLRCDEDMTVEDGRSYQCVGTTADDEDVTVTITITGLDGDYTWSAG